MPPLHRARLDAIPPPLHPTTNRFAREQPQLHLPPPTQDQAMSRPVKLVHCVGSPDFKPEDLIEDAERQKQALELLAKNDLYNASRMLLRLPDPDTYTYHAMTSVKLAQVQSVVDLGGANGLHTWYRNEDRSPVRE